MKKDIHKLPRFQTNIMLSRTDHPWKNKQKQKVEDSNKKKRHFMDMMAAHNN